MTTLQRGCLVTMEAVEDVGAVRTRMREKNLSTRVKVVKFRDVVDVAIDSEPEVVNTVVASHFVHGKHLCRGHDAPSISSQKSASRPAACPGPAADSTKHFSLSNTY